MRPDLLRRLLKVGEASPSYVKMVSDTGELQKQIEEGYRNLMESINKREIMESTRLLRKLNKLSKDLGELVRVNENLLGKM